MRTMLAALLLALSTSATFAADAAAPAKPAGKPAAKTGAPKWVDLFDGKSLKGWIILSGFATYEVQDGCIVGAAREFSPNTFLCTDKSYGNFILEFEVLCDPALNSGVQIRSHVYGDETELTLEKDGKPVKRRHPAGRVYGYQVEIAAAASGASGGIYDEARQGVWVSKMPQDPAAAAAFKDSQWNKYRVECVGNSIKTFINGVPCADKTDATDARGFIGLQVHGIRGAAPLQVKWKNIRIQVLDQPAK